MSNSLPSPPASASASPFTRSIPSIADLASWPQPHAVLKTDGSTGGAGVAISRNSLDHTKAFRKLHRPLTAPTALKRLIVNRDPLALWTWHTRPNATIVAQEWITGPNANSMIACWQGAVLASVAVEVLASQGATGAATVVRFIHHKAIDQAAHKLARHLNLSGFYGLDFILEHTAEGCPTDNAFLIELNPRCTQLGHLILPHQGDLAAALLSAFTGRPHPITGMPITGDTVAFYPQTLIWNPDTPYLSTGHHDIPQDAPNFTAELLLQEWPYRQLPARLYHRFFPPR